MDERVTSATASGSDRVTLSQADVDEFKTIVARGCGVQLNDHDAWNRVIELMNLYRALLGPIPEDPETRVRTSSHLHSGHGDNSDALE